MDVEDLFGLLVWVLIIVSAISKNKKKKAQQAAPKKAKQPAAPWEQAAAPAPAKPVKPAASTPVWDAVLQNATGEVADVIRATLKNAEARKAKPAAQQLSMPLPSAPLGGITPLAPTVHTHREPDCDVPDRSGSLDYNSTEGKDPCHQEQFTPLTAAVRDEEAQPALRLDFSGGNMLQAFVMQEVLTRPCDRRRTCAR